MFKNAVMNLWNKWVNNNSLGSTQKFVKFVDMQCYIFCPKCFNKQIYDYKLYTLEYYHEFDDDHTFKCNECKYETLPKIIPARDREGNYIGNNWMVELNYHNTFFINRTGFIDDIKLETLPEIKMSDDKKSIIIEYMGYDKWIVNSPVLKELTFKIDEILRCEISRKHIHINTLDNSLTTIAYTNETITGVAVNQTMKVNEQHPYNMNFTDYINANQKYSDI